MRTMETDAADNYIQKLKYFDEGDTLRLTFQWPLAIGQVYIFKSGDDFDIETADEKTARLLTLQEYKKQAGFVDRKTPGAHIYWVFPFIREDGEDIAIVQADGKNKIECMTGQIVVLFSIREKRQWLSGDKVIHIQLVCDQYVEDDVLCYVKKENGYPAHPQDGVIYFFGEPLPPGRRLERQIKIKKNEFIRLFVCDPAKAPLYKLQMM